MHRSSRRVLIVIVILFFVHPPPNVRACSYDLPPWYSVIAVIQPPSLPAGVRVESHIPEAGSVAAAIMRITNTSLIPLYVIAKGGEDYEPIGPTFPAGYGPSEKVVNGTAWTWTPPKIAGKPTWTWQPRGTTLDVHIGKSSIQASRGVILFYRAENRTGDNRPANATPPPPEQVDLPLVYGSEPLTIPIHIRYILNPDYTPHAEAEVWKRCYGETRPTGGAQSPVGLSWRAILFLGGSMSVVLLGIIRWRQRLTKG